MEVDCASQVQGEAESKNDVVGVLNVFDSNTLCDGATMTESIPRNNCVISSNSVNVNEDCAPLSDQNRHISSGERTESLSSIVKICSEEGSDDKVPCDVSNEVVQCSSSDSHTSSLNNCDSSKIITCTSSRLDPPGNISASNFNEPVIKTSDESSKDESELESHNYRNLSDSSVSDLSSSTENDSDIEIEFEDIVRKGPRRYEPTCRGEVLLRDLPPIEDLKISVPEQECIKIGKVSSIVNELVIVQVLPNTPVLDLGSVLFLQSGKVSLGKIFDVLGQVKEPYYAVRFNSESHARERGVTEGTEVYCAPKTDYTSFVFVSEIMKMRGSDASWEHNNEPPVVCLDYSDDEAERMARRTLTSQKHGEEKDTGPPRKKRGIGHKQQNAYHAGKNNVNQQGSHMDNNWPEVSPIGGHSILMPPHPHLHPPGYPPRPIYPSIHPSRLPHPPGHPPIMFTATPPNPSLPVRANFRPSLLGPHPRNFRPSAPPFFVRPFHVLPAGPPPPLPPPFISSPHVRPPIIHPPRFQLPPLN